MSVNKPSLLIILLMMSLAACHPQTAPQNEDMAIGTANLFFKELAQGHYETVYENYLDPDMKQEGRNALAGFEDYFSSFLEENGPMTKVIFSAFQGVPKRPEIQVYYKVTHEKNGDMEYHLVLKGDSQKGYRVKILDIGNRLPYPPGIEQLPEFQRMRKVGVVEVDLGLAK